MSPWSLPRFVRATLSRVRSSRSRRLAIRSPLVQPLAPTSVPTYPVTASTGRASSRNSEATFETCGGTIWFAFLLGCSFTFEHALVEAGISPRNVELDTKVSMFASSITEARVDLVRDLSARYPHAHGAPIHVGDPKAVGIADLSRPDYGEPVPMSADEIPVFWACGVTSQAVAEKARVELMMTHESAQMFVTDLPREADREWSPARADQLR